jgi:hypothetical protein
MDMVAALPPHSVSDSVVIIEGQPHYVADKSAAEEALFAHMFIGVGPVDNGVMGVSVVNKHNQQSDMIL